MIIRKIAKMFPLGSRITPGNWVAVPHTMHIKYEFYIGGLRSRFFLIHQDEPYQFLKDWKIVRFVEK